MIEFIFYNQLITNSLTSLNLKDYTSPKALQVPSHFF